MAASRLVRTNYFVRTGAFAYCFAALGAHLLDLGAGLFPWILFAAQFLAYPHLLYWRAVHSANPRRAELDNLFIDSALLGFWCAYLGFPTWITYALLAGTMLNAAVNRGLSGAFLALNCSAAGAALYLLLGELSYRPQTSPLVTFLCFFGVLAYTCAVGTVAYRQHLRIAGAREDIRLSEERYRLIVENVADLIGIVDSEARWRFASPRYAQVLAPEHLAIGADAFARAHPDDAEQARRALGRAAVTGKAREMPLRLVDRDGRMRQYRLRIQPLAAPGATSAPADRLLLVSQDLTDLRESEEKVLLAAHALEGMTEAILITAADGTVLTVNRAFAQVTGHAREDVLGQPEKTLRHALQPPEHYDQIYATVQREGYWSGTQWSRRKNGSVYREWRSIRALRDAAGRTTHYVHVFYEVGAPRHTNGSANVEGSG